jgi:Cytochrome oxidase complex assembly protein 1
MRCDLTAFKIVTTIVVLSVTSMIVPPVIVATNTYTLSVINLSIRNMNRWAIDSHFRRYYMPKHNTKLPQQQQKPFSTSSIRSLDKNHRNSHQRMAFISTSNNENIGSDQSKSVTKKDIFFACRAIDTPISRIQYNSFVPTIPTRTRLYHSSPQRNLFRKDDNNKNDNESSSILGQVKKIAQKFLPSTWFRTEEEKREIAEQKRIQSDIQTGIQQIFKDAPLPIRMVSNMIGPIFSSMMSSIAETAASQQSMVDIVYDQAVQSIQTDPAVQMVLGDRITVGRPFSQSSSSSSINGATTIRIELAFPISGRLGEGIGRLVASASGNNNPIVQTLEVQANGNVIDINTRISSSSQRLKSYAPNSSYKGDSNIIDAEIIEKDTKN